MRRGDGRRWIASRRWRNQAGPQVADATSTLRRLERLVSVDVDDDEWRRLARVICDGDQENEDRGGGDHSERGFQHRSVDFVQMKNTTRPRSRAFKTCTFVQHFHCALPQHISGLTSDEFVFAVQSLFLHSLRVVSHSLSIRCPCKAGSRTRGHIIVCC